MKINMIAVVHMPAILIAALFGLYAYNDTGNALIGLAFTLCLSLAFSPVATSIGRLINKRTA